MEPAGGTNHLSGPRCSQLQGKTQLGYFIVSSFPPQMLKNKWKNGKRITLLSSSDHRKYPPTQVMGKNTLQLSKKQKKTKHFPQEFYNIYIVIFGCLIKRC